MNTLRPKWTPSDLNEHPPTRIFLIALVNMKIRDQIIKTTINRYKLSRIQKSLVAHVERHLWSKIDALRSVSSTFNPSCPPVPFEEDCIWFLVLFFLDIRRRQLWSRKVATEYLISGAILSRQSWRCVVIDSNNLLSISNHECVWIRHVLQTDGKELHPANFPATCKPEQLVKWNIDHSVTAEIIILETFFNRISSANIF
jgi:hypothetical protein